MSDCEYSLIWNFQIFHVSQKHRNSWEYQGLICAQETGDKFKKNKSWGELPIILKREN